MLEMFTQEGSLGLDDAISGLSIGHLGFNTQEFLASESGFRFVIAESFSRSDILVPKKELDARISLYAISPSAREHNEIIPKVISEQNSPPVIGDIVGGGLIKSGADSTVWVLDKSREFGAVPQIVRARLEMLIAKYLSKETPIVECNPRERSTHEISPYEPDVHIFWFRYREVMLAAQKAIEDLAFIDSLQLYREFETKRVQNKSAL